MDTLHGNIKLNDTTHFREYFFQEVLMGSAQSHIVFLAFYWRLQAPSRAR